MSLLQLEVTHRGALAFMGTMALASFYRCHFHTKCWTLNTPKQSDVMISTILGACESTTHKKKKGYDDSIVVIMQGKEAITHLLAQSQYSSSPLANTSTFYNWAMNTIQSKNRSDFPNEFQKRQALVELACLHENEILQLEENEIAATAAWQALPEFAMYSDLITKRDANKQILEKLNTQLENNTLTPEKLSNLQSLIQEKNLIQFKLCADLKPYHDIHERQECVQAKDLREKLLSDLGITAAKKDLEKSIHETGVRRGKGGFKFEDVAAKIVQNELLEKISRQHNIPVASLLVLRNITFNMASCGGSPGEIDLLVCVKSSDGRDEVFTTSTSARARTTVTDEVLTNRKEKMKVVAKKLYFDVDVLAVIEVKKNCDDVGKSFLSYQSTLNWLCGDEETYSAQDWRCKAYPSGHFVKPYVHSLRNDPSTSQEQEQRQEQHNLVFSQKSFHYIRENRVAMIIPGINPVDSAVLSVDHLNTPQDKQTPIKFVCKDLFYVSMSTNLENINSKEVKLLHHRLATNKKIFKLRQSLESDHGRDEQHNKENLRDELQRCMEDIRMSSILNSKFQNTFCTSDLLNAYVSHGLHDQLYCVMEKN